MVGQGVEIEDEVKLAMSWSEAGVKGGQKRKRDVKERWRKGEKREEKGGSGGEGKEEIVEGGGGMEGRRWLQTRRGS